MTVTYKQGNILNSDAQVLVNPVNCVGVMGKGLAKQFADTYPEILKWYKKWPLRPGEISPILTKDGKIIACAATKFHWKNPSKLEWIEDCAENLKLIFEDLSGDELVNGVEITKVAVPPLGAGLGGLNKKDVEEILIKTFESSKIEFELYDFK